MNGFVLSNSTKKHLKTMELHNKSNGKLIQEKNSGIFASNNTRRALNKINKYYQELDVREKLEKIEENILTLSTEQLQNLENNSEFEEFDRIVKKIKFIDIPDSFPFESPIPKRKRSSRKK